MRIKPATLNSWEFIGNIPNTKIRYRTYYSISTYYKQKIHTSEGEPQPPGDSVVVFEPSISTQFRLGEYQGTLAPLRLEWQTATVKGANLAGLLTTTVYQF